MNIKKKKEKRKEKKKCSHQFKSFEMKFYTCVHKENIKVDHIHQS